MAGSLPQNDILSPEETRWCINRILELESVVSLTAGTQAQETRPKIAKHYVKVVLLARRLSVRKRLQFLIDFETIHHRFVDLLRSLSSWAESIDRTPLHAESHVAVIGEVAKFFESLGVHKGLPDRLRADVERMLGKIKSDSSHLIGDGNVPTDSELSDAVLTLAFEFGWTMDRIFAPAFEIAEKDQEARRKGASVTNEAHSELWPEYQKKVDELMKTGVKYYPATEQVAAAEGVSGRTVRNHTCNPSPQSRGKKKRK